MPKMEDERYLIHDVENRSFVTKHETDGNKETDSEFFNPAMQRHSNPLLLNTITRRDGAGSLKTSEEKTQDPNQLKIKNPHTLEKRHSDTAMRSKHGTNQHRTEPNTLLNRKTDQLSSETGMTENDIHQIEPEIRAYESSTKTDEADQHQSERETLTYQKPIETDMTEVDTRGNVWEMASTQIIYQNTSSLFIYVEETGDKDSLWSWQDHTTSQVHQRVKRITCSKTFC